MSQERKPFSPDTGKTEIMTISHIPRVLLSFLLAVTLFAPNQSHGEGEAHLDIVLKDHINHEWSHELLSYDVTFDAGTCHLSTLELSGPEGALPVQLSGVQADGGGFVTAAQLWFITDLPALDALLEPFPIGRVSVSNHVARRFSE